MEKGFVWINGASSGIGEATARSFAAERIPLLLTARRSDKLQQIKSELESSSSLEIRALDISDINSVKQFDVSQITGGYPDCLINNAGITTFTPAENDSIELISEIINTNLTGAIACIKQVLPGMIERRQGTIINILSAAAKKIFTNSSIYAASKAGLAMYSKVLREEVRKYNIRVINIYPGATATPIWPESVLAKHSERMMAPSDLGRYILDLYEHNDSVITEEIELRPLKGDL